MQPPSIFKQKYRTRPKAKPNRPRPRHGKLAANRAVLRVTQAPRARVRADDF